MLYSGPPTEMPGPLKRSSEWAHPHLTDGGGGSSYVMADNFSFSITILAIVII